MYRKFIALISAAAIAIAAVAATTAPARADTQDVAKVLAGLAALAIIGAAINDHNANAPQVVTRNPYPKGGYYPRGNYYPQHTYRPQPVQPRPVPPAVTRYDLPAQCLSNFNLRRGNVQLYRENCLQNNYRHVNALPNACRIDVRTANDVRRAYDPNCLRSRGYRNARN